MNVMKSTYIISYDLKDSESEEYQELFNYIKSLCGNRK